MKNIAEELGWDPIKVDDDDDDDEWNDDVNYNDDDSENRAGNRTSGLGLFADFRLARSGWNHDDTYFQDLQLLPTYTCGYDAHICMMHLSMILDPDICMYDAYMNVLRSLTEMHVCLICTYL